MGRQFSGAYSYLQSSGQIEQWKNGAGIKDGRVPKWSFDRIIKTIREHNIKGRTDLYKRFNGAYNYATRNKLLDELNPYFSGTGKQQLQQQNNDD